MDFRYNQFGMTQRPVYMSFSGVITSIETAGNMGRYDGCSQVVTVENESGNVVNFFMNADTFVVDYTTLYESLPVTVFYNGNAGGSPDLSAAVCGGGHRSPDGRTDGVRGLFQQCILKQRPGLKLNLAPFHHGCDAEQSDFPRKSRRSYAGGALQSDDQKHSAADYSRIKSLSSAGSKSGGRRALFRILQSAASGFRIRYNIGSRSPLKPPLPGQRTGRGPPGRWASEPTVTIFPPFLR